MFAAVAARYAGLTCNVVTHLTIHGEIEEFNGEKWFARIECNSEKAPATGHFSQLQPF